MPVHAPRCSMEHHVSTPRSMARGGGSHCRGTAAGGRAGRWRRCTSRRRGRGQPLNLPRRRTKPRVPAHRANRNLGLCRGLGISGHYVVRTRVAHAFSVETALLANKQGKDDLIFGVSTHVNYVVVATSHWHHMHCVGQGALVMARGGVMRGRGQRQALHAERTCAPTAHATTSKLGERRSTMLGRVGG